MSNKNVSCEQTQMWHASSMSVKEGLSLASIMRNLLQLKRVHIT